MITETEVNEAQTDLADEVTPQITELLKRAEQSLSKLERKQFALKSKVCVLFGTTLSIGGLASRATITETDKTETSWIDDGRGQGVKGAVEGCTWQEGTIGIYG